MPAEVWRKRRHLLVVLTAAALWAVPASAEPDSPAAARKCQSAECKPARAQEQQEQQEQAPAAKASKGGSASHSWFSFFRRQSSVLQP